MYSCGVQEDSRPLPGLAVAAGSSATVDVDDEHVSGSAMAASAPANLMTRVSVLLANWTPVSFDLLSRRQLGPVYRGAITPLLPLAN